MLAIPLYFRSHLWTSLGSNPKSTPARSPVAAVGCLAHTPFVFLHLDFHMFSFPSSFTKVHRTFRRF